MEARKRLHCRHQGNIGGPDDYSDRHRYVLSCGLCRTMQYYFFKILFDGLSVLLAQFIAFLSKQINRLELQRRGVFSHSSLVSLVIRPWFEKDKIKQWIGAPLAAFVIIGGATQLPEADVALASWEVTQPVTQLLDAEYELPVVTTKSRFEMPITSLLGVSQRYHSGHPGADMRAPMESDVVSIDYGVVEEVVESPVGYGTHIYVSHEDGMDSLYAHLDDVKVAEGQYLAKGQPIATVGMTGLSTGPHLHFEVLINDQHVNPIPLIAEAIEDYQSTLSAGN